jgi:hypothetical protein
MLTGLLGQSSTCAAACAQTKNVPRSTRATRALRALPCAGVPTAGRRTTALSRPMTIALSDTPSPSRSLALRTSDACVQPNAESNPLPSSNTGVGMTSRWKTRRIAGTLRARRSSMHTFLRTPRADDTCSNAQISGRTRSRRVRRATVERKTSGRAQPPGTQGARERNRRPIPTHGARFMSSPFRSRCMDTGCGTRWAPETTKPMCRCRELLPRAGVCHEEW